MIRICNKNRALILIFSVIAFGSLLYFSPTYAAITIGTGSCAEVYHNPGGWWCDAP